MTVVESESALPRIIRAELVDAARRDGDLIEEAIRHARRNGRWEPLFEGVVLECWLTVQRQDEARFHALRARLPDGHSRELHFRLREAARQAKAVSAPDGEEDWPGNGSVVRFLTTPAPPRRDLVRNRLLANRAHVLAGMGGVSKTKFLYHLAIGSVIGRLPWDWEYDRTGSAVLVLTEDTTEDVHQSLWAFINALQLSGDECTLLAEQLHIFALAGRNCRLLASVGGELVETSRVEALIGTLRAIAPVFVGFDPALAATEGNELDQAHQRRLGEMFDRIAIELDACVVVAAHASKGLQNAEEIGSHSARGAGALTDAVRGEFTLRGMTAPEARTFGIDSVEERLSHVQLAFTKSNAMPPSARVPLWLRRGQGGVLEPADLVPRARPVVGPREIRALELLSELARVSAPTLRAWREACIAAKLINGATAPAREKAHDRIRDALLASGLIERGATRGIYVPRAVE